MQRLVRNLVILAVLAILAGLAAWIFPEFKAALGLTAVVLLLALAAWQTLSG